MANQNDVPTSQDPGLERAIHLSLLEHARTRLQVKDIFDEDSNPSPSLLMSLKNEFPPIFDPLGDTAIYIGVPEQEPGQSDWEYQRAITHFNVVHVVHSSRLLAMPETSRFTHNDLLGPSSIRSERRLRKLGVLDRLETERGGRKFKYYIDLRPPTEDDAAVEAITKLNCPRGILTWHLLKAKYNLSELDVAGHDGIQEAAFPDGTAEAVKDAAPEATDPPANQDQGANEPTETSKPEAKVGESYTRLRHHAALERLLNAICDNDPKLDSAPKVWTFFAVAQCFGCAEHHRVAGWITTWIFNGDNANFIQNNPEVAYRIGMGIQSPDLVRDAFSILVGERALLYAVDKLKQNPTPRNFVRSIHGREFDELDDDESSRISAASLALLERVTNDVGLLCRDLSWLEGSTEYAKLTGIIAETPEEEDTLLQAKSFVEDYVRTVFIYCLCLEYRTFSGLETTQTQKAVYDCCSPSERMLTKTFWLLLSESDHFRRTLMGTEMLVNGFPGDLPFKKAFNALGLDRPIRPIIKLTGTALFDKINVVNKFWLRRSTVTTHKGKEVAHHPFGYGFRNDFSCAENSPVQDHTFEHDESSNYVQSADHSGSPSKRRKTSSFHQDAVRPSSSINGDAFGSKTREIQTDWVPDEWLDQRGSSDGIPHRIPDLVFRPKPVAENVFSTAVNRFNENQPTRAEFELPQISGQPKPALTLDVVNADHQDIFQFDPQDEPIGNRAATGGPSSTAVVASAARRRQHRWSSAGCPAHQVSSLLSPGVCIDRNELTSYAMALFDEATMSHEGSPQQDAYRDRAYLSVKPKLMMREIHEQINRLCDAIIRPAHQLHHGIELSSNQFDSLVCLNSNELRFLPIWCPDGNDDGTGGVFDDLPLMNTDPAVSFSPGQIPKRGYVDDDSEDGQSSFKDIASEAVSTVGKASRLATDGSQTDTVQSLDDINVGESAQSDTDSISDFGADTLTLTRTATVVEGLTRQVALLFSDSTNGNGTIHDTNNESEDESIQLGSDFDDLDDVDHDDDADTVVGDSESNDRDHERDQVREQEGSEHSSESESDFEML